MVPAGSVIAFEYTFKYPEVYLLVNHELIKATEKGQAVQIRVEGETNPDIMTVVSPPSQINQPDVWVCHPESFDPVRLRRDSRWNRISGLNP